MLAPPPPPNTASAIVIVSPAVTPVPALTIVISFISTSPAVVILATLNVRSAAPPPPKLASAIVIVSLTALAEPIVTTVTDSTAPPPPTCTLNVPTVPEPLLVPVTPLYVPNVRLASAAPNVSTLVIPPAGLTITLYVSHHRLYLLHHCMCQVFYLLELV